MGKCAKSARHRCERGCPITEEGAQIMGARNGDRIQVGEDRTGPFNFVDTSATHGQSRCRNSIGHLAGPCYSTNKHRKITPRRLRIRSRLFLLFLLPTSSPEKPISTRRLDRVSPPGRARVEDAIRAGSAVPSRVRRFYPELFSDIPDGVDTKELVTLLTGWKTMTGPVDIMACLESTHESLRRHDRDSAMLVVRGGRLQDEMDTARQSLLKRLALFTWLEPLVSAGGVFAEEPKVLVA